MTAGPRVVLLLGAVVIAVAVLVAWLTRPTNDPSSRPTAATGAERATETVDPLPMPAFAAEPVALEANVGTPTGDAAGASAVTAGGTAPAESLRALVVHSDDTPATGVTVVAAAGETVLDTQITDAEGAAQFSISDGRVELYVGGATLIPQRFEIEPAHGTHRLELPAGAFVGGVVLLDGQPPEEPIGLVLAPSDYSVFDAPFSVRRALGAMDYPGEEELGQQSSGGRFLFSGLPHDWSGWIGFPADYRLEGESPYSGFEVSQPARNLVVRLTWNGAVTGRVVEPRAGTGPPDPSAWAEIRYKVEKDGGWYTSSMQADGDGRFRLPLVAESPTNVDLQFRAAHGRGRATRRLEALDPQIGSDLGDIELETTQRAFFVVIDEKGDPIAGAVATALDETRARSRPTLPSGRGELPDIMQGTGSFRVDALGFHPATVTLPAAGSADDDATLEVRLSRAPRLELHLVTSDGAPAGVTVEYHAMEKVFDCDDCWSIDPLQEELGASSLSQGGWDGGQASGKIRTDSAGRILLTRVRAGVPFTLAVHDRYGKELRPPESLVLAPGEQRRLEWGLGAQPRTIRVAVSSSSGAPIAGASVVVKDAQSWIPRTYWGVDGSERWTGAEGTVTFPEVYSERVSVQAEAKGHGTKWLTDRLVPAGGANFELLLDAGRQVDIEVVDAEGQPRKASVTMGGGPRLVAAEELSPGLYRIADAPAGTVTLRAEVARRIYSVSHDTAGSRARIVIPALGSLRARWSVPLQADLEYHVFVQDAGSDTWNNFIAVSSATRGSGGPISFGDALRPGDYDVVLRQGRGWIGENPPVSQVARVTVKPGEVTEVLLEP